MSRYKFIECLADETLHRLSDELDSGWISIHDTLPLIKHEHCIVYMFKHHLTGDWHQIKQSIAKDPPRTEQS